MAHVHLLCNGVAFFYSIGGLQHKHRGLMQQPQRSEEVQYVVLTCVRAQQPCSMTLKRLQRREFVSKTQLDHNSAMTIDGQVPLPQRGTRGFQALRNSAHLDSCPVRKTLQTNQMQRPTYPSTYPLTHLPAYPSTHLIRQLARSGLLSVGKVSVRPGPHATVLPEKRRLIFYVFQPSECC